MINIAVLITILVLFVIVFAYMNMQMKYFPSVSSDKLRILEKTNGFITSYKPQVNRPFFGWTSFYASKYSGEIWTSSSWSNDKDQSEEMLLTYNKLTAAKFTTKVL